MTLSNPHIAASWSVDRGSFRAAALSGLNLPPDVFSLVLEGGRVLKSTQLTIVGKPRFAAVAPNPQSVRRADRRHGRELTILLRDPETGAEFEWRAILLDASRYLRQELLITARSRDLPLKQVRLWDLDLPGVRVLGTVKGSPAVAGETYFACEHPLSITTVAGSRAQCYLDRTLPLRAGRTFLASSVIGFAAPGQLRRDFLTYIEDQRAHPYRTFLHYNSWYDIGYFSKYDEAMALDRIHAFGRELKQKRGVILDSFLFDDGWDDPASLWSFDPGFPNGFSKVAQATAAIGAGTGVWLSPWGGYGKPKQERIRFGRQQGFEIEDGGFALSGPKYFERFRDVCRRMIADYDVNQFKFDGTGNANKVSPGSQFDSDFDAAISLIGDLRRSKPDLYVNLTTGTYPSPFWLRFADSIWRGGEDHDFAGSGSWRQRWITYRDSQTFRHVVTAGPLYPINSLMLHGLIYASKANHLDTDPAGDFRAEVRAYFGTGTQLQEMYISPALLSPQNWDDLAEAALWSRNNAATLVDTHWIGGDPAHEEIYGWASWSQSKGIVSLRNPSDRTQTFSVDAEKLFDLPPSAPSRYRASSPWKDEKEKPPVILEAGKPREIRLAPFEILNLEAHPAR